MTEAEANRPYNPPDEPSHMPFQEDETLMHAFAIINAVESGKRELDAAFFTALEYRSTHMTGNFLPYSPRIKRAIEFDEEIHAGQVRKRTGLAYRVHDLGVAEIVARVTKDENTLIAALIHDDIEDAGKPRPDGTVTKGPEVVRNEIRFQFGDEVYQMVNDVTAEYPNQSWERRKAHENKRFDKIHNHGSYLIKTADIIYNTRDLIEWYLEAGESMFLILNGNKRQQLKRYEQLLSKFKRNWPQNPLLPDMEHNINILKGLWAQKK